MTKSDSLFCCLVLQKMEKQKEKLFGHFNEADIATAKKQGRQKRAAHFLRLGNTKIPKKI